MAGLRAFTIIELLVVTTIIVVLVALLVPSMEQAMAQAQVARCAANMKQTATGWFTYIQDHQGKLPGVAYRGSGIARVKHFADPRFISTVPNPLGSLVPYWGGGRDAFICPVAQPISADLDPTGEYTPNDLSDSNYYPNGVVFLVKLPQVPRLASTIFMQENIYRTNSIWYRPGDGNVSDAKEVYRWWHFNPGTGEAYTSIHDAGGNLAFGDGHVEYRKGAALRARDFALTGGAGTGNADDTQQADSNLTYAPDF